MFVRMVTVPATSEAFEELDIIKKQIMENAFPILKEQEGWSRTDIIYNEESRQFKVITYWESKEQAVAIIDKEPELSTLQYALFGRFVEWFENENLIVEYFDHFVTMEK